MEDNYGYINAKKINPYVTENDYIRVIFSNLSEDKNRAVAIRQYHKSKKGQSIIGHCFDKPLKDVSLEAYIKLNDIEKKWLQAGKYIAIEVTKERVYQHNPNEKRKEIGVVRRKEKDKKENSPEGDMPNSKF